MEAYVIVHRPHIKVGIRWRRRRRFCLDTWHQLNLKRSTMYIYTLLSKSNNTTEVPTVSTNWLARPSHEINNRLISYALQSALMSLHHSRSRLFSLAPSFSAACLFPVRRPRAVSHAHITVPVWSIQESPSTPTVRWHQAVRSTLRASFFWISQLWYTSCLAHNSMCYLPQHLLQTDWRIILSYFAKKTLKLIRRKKAINIYWWQEAFNLTHFVA